MPLTPNLDENGAVVAQDHEGIVDDDLIIRRISEQQITFDKATGRRRISSLAYNGASAVGKGMSVDIEKLISADGKDPKEFVTNPRWFCSVFFRAGDLRAEALKIGPVPQDDNPYHGEVWGNFTGAKKRRLMRTAAWYVPIDGVDLCP